MDFEYILVNKPFNNSLSGVDRLSSGGRGLSGDVSLSGVGRVSSDGRVSSVGGRLFFDSALIWVSELFGLGVEKSFLLNRFDRAK